MDMVETKKKIASNIGVNVL